MGGTTALTSFTSSGATITQNATAISTGAISYTGSTAINLGGNITTNGATIGLTGPVTLTADTVLDTTNAGGTAAGANITLSSTLQWRQKLYTDRRNRRHYLIWSSWRNDSFNYFNNHWSYDHANCERKNNRCHQLYRKYSH